MSGAADAEADGDTLVLELSPPLMVKGVTYTSLTVQEPRAQQVRLAEMKLDANLSEASVTEYEMEMVRLVAGVPAKVVEALTVRQLGTAFNFMAEFIADPYKGIDDSDVPPDAFDQPLDPPLSWDGGQILCLPLREPTAEELRKARNFMRSAVTAYTHRSYQMELLTMVTGLNPAVIHGLRIRDLTQASRHLALFIAAGRKTGKR